MYDSPSLQYNVIPCCVSIASFFSLVLATSTAPPAVTQSMHFLLVGNQFQPNSSVPLCSYTVLQPQCAVVVYKGSACLGAF